MTASADVIVIGLGGMGSAAARVLTAGPWAGELLADLALDGATRQPIGFLSANRLLDPGS